MQNLTKPMDVFVRLLLIISAIEAGIMYLLPYLVRDEAVRAVLDPILLAVCGAPFVWRTIVSPLRSLALSEMDRNRVSEERYRYLFQHMLNGFAFCGMLFDEKGNAVDFVYLAVNDAFGTLLGLHGVEGKRLTEVIPEFLDHHPEVLETYARVARGGQPESFEFDFRIFDMWLSISVYSPEPDHFVAVFEDITDRKRAEAEILRAKEEWERTFDAIVDPVMILGTDHQVLKANRAMRELFGGELGGAEQLICHRCLHGSEAPVVSCPHARLMEDGQPHSEELYLPGLGLHLLVVVSPLFDAKGALQGSVHYARDVTEQKKLERQLQQSQKLEAIGTMAGGVAHDFNNILTAIMGYGSMLERELAGKDRGRHCLDGIMSAAERAANLTSSLLSFSRKKEIALKPIDLNLVVRDTGKLLRRLVRADIELRQELARSELGVMGDGGQLGQVLMNLVTNSQDAIEGCGTITLTTGRFSMDPEFVRRHGFGSPGVYALLTYSDTGCGMDEATLQRIFEPFFTTKGVGRGTGLGLAIVYGIVNQHNGHIHCSSHLGQGTTFRFYLPLAGVVTAREKRRVETTWPTGTETILLVEDDEQIRVLLSEVLEESGYRVVAARDGHDAVSLFSANRQQVSLVVTDLVMPGLNGVEAFKRMKEVRPELRAVFLSGCDGNRLATDPWLEEQGMFLHKPLQPRDLLVEVRRMLDT